MDITVPWTEDLRERDRDRRNKRRKGHRGENGVSYIKSWGRKGERGQSRCVGRKGNR